MAQQQSLGKGFCVGIAAWIIQDGNYNDFRVGQQAEFAMEFYPVSLRPSDDCGQSFRHLKANLYQVVGRVVFVTQKVWVIDVGFMLFQETRPPSYATRHSWFAGEIEISIDPYFYREYLHGLPGMPELTYGFQITDIFLEQTPWLISKDEVGRTVMERNKRKESYTAINETDAWKDDEGRAHYILQCRWLAPPFTRVLSHQ
jgi:hypothetical protein